MPKPPDEHPFGFELVIVKPSDFWDWWRCEVEVELFLEFAHDAFWKACYEPHREAFSFIQINGFNFDLSCGAGTHWRKP